MDVRSERSGGCAIDDVADGMLSNTNVYRRCKYKVLVVIDRRTVDPRTHTNVISDVVIP